METPKLSFPAIKQGLLHMAPDTRVVVPVALVITGVWLFLNTVRERDLDKMASVDTAIRTEISSVRTQGEVDNAQLRAAITALSANLTAAYQRSEDILLRVTRNETTQQYTGATMTEIKQDIRDIKSILQKENKP